MADDSFNVDQSFEKLSDNDAVIYDSDLLNPTDLAGTEETIRELVEEFHHKASEDFQAHCFLLVENKSDGVVISTYTAPGAFVVEDHDVNPDLAKRLSEAAVVQITEPDVNGDFDAGFKKDGMVAFSNCGPPKMF